MFKTLSAAALSLAVAVSSLSATATPARAGNNDLAKFLFGAVALGIIAKGIADANDNGNRSTVTVNRNNPRPHYNNQNNRRDDRHQNNRPRVQRVPDQCATQARLRHGGRVATVYGRPCLRRNGIRTARADNCARTGYLNGRNLTYYTARCLRRNGYRF